MKTNLKVPYKAWYTRCIQVSIQVSWIQVFWSCIPYKKLESKNLNGLGWNRNASYFSFNLDGTWMEIGQSEDRILISINLWMYIITTTCCAKMAGKEETPKCRKKTVTWTNEMIEDLIDFIEIHPIVAFEAIHEPILTSFWSLISFAVQLYIIMQYKGKHPPFFVCKITNL